MTQDLYATQQSVIDYLTTEGDFAVYDTMFPAAVDEPQSNGLMEPYVVVRFNDSVRAPLGGSLGGARYDVLYTLIDFLCIGAAPEDARQLAYGEDGVSDIMTGYTPVDASQLTKAGGGQVFVVNDGSNSAPTRTIARVSMRCTVNLRVTD